MRELIVGIAILRSVELGYGGRIYCESLPQAEEFHRTYGVAELKGLSNEGLKRFQFTEASAATFLDRLRQEGLIP